MIARVPKARMMQVCVLFYFESKNARMLRKDECSMLFLMLYVMKSSGM